MASDASWFLYALGIVGGLLISGAVIYVAVRYAVLHALRDHIMSSTTGVSITSAVPLKVIDVTPATETSEPASS